MVTIHVQKNQTYCSKDGKLFAKAFCDTTVLTFDTSIDKVDDQVVFYISFEVWPSVNSFLIMKRVWSVSKKKHSSNVTTPRSKQTNENLDSQLPEHLSPSPEKPVLQTQVNEPMVLIHLASTSQTGTEALHSSMSK